jgi:hypothetical protein
MIKLKPVTINTLPGEVTIDRAQCSLVYIQMGTPAKERTANGEVQLGTEDAEGNFVPAISKTAAMTPEQYAAWGTDDAYATEVLCINLGLEPV